MLFQLNVMTLWYTHKKQKSYNVDQQLPFTSLKNAGHLLKTTGWVQKQRDTIPLLRKIIPRSALKSDESPKQNF